MKTRDLILAKILFRLLQARSATLRWGEDPISAFYDNPIPNLGEDLIEALAHDSVVDPTPILIETPESSVDEDLRSEDCSPNTFESEGSEDTALEVVEVVVSVRIHV